VLSAWRTHGRSARMAAQCGAVRDLVGSTLTLANGEVVKDVEGSLGDQTLHGPMDS